MTRRSSAVALASLMLALIAACPIANAASLVGDDVTVKLLYPDLSTVYQDFGPQTVVTPAAEMTAVFGDFDINIEASSIRIDILHDRHPSAAAFNGFEFSDLDFSPASVVTGFTLTTTVDGYGASRVTFGPHSIWIDLGDTLLVADRYILVDLVTTAVPEPTTMLLWGTTAIGLASVTRWRRHRRSA